MSRHGTNSIFVAALALTACSILVVAMPRKPSGPRIRVVPKEAEHRVDVSIDEQPFTSYIWPDTLKKPVLYPLRSSKGTIVTRGFPLEPRLGERTDHPHHAGLWLNYENVNGLDFWNNSDAIKPKDRGKMGTIYHRAVVSASGGADSGELVTESDWKSPDGKVLLQEHTQFVFRGGPGVRSVDRITTLRAVDDKVVFKDEKDGLLGLRVTRALEIPSTKPEVFLDSSGRPTKVAKMDNAGVNGTYLTSEGKKGDEAWGTRGRWCILSGNVDKEPVTTAILDHPKNPGFPTYWHARGYGLFAANPLGQKIFSGGKEELNFTLDPKQSVTFRYRIVILSKIASADDIEAAYKEFAATYK